MDRLHWRSPALLRAAMVVLCWVVYAVPAKAFQDPPNPFAAKAPSRPVVRRPPVPAATPPKAPTVGSGERPAGKLLRFGKLRIRSLPPLVSESSIHGYTSYRFVVYNDADAAKDVRLLLRGTHIDGYYLKEIARTATIPAKGQARLVLRHPRLTMVKRRIELWSGDKKLGVVRPQDVYPVMYERLFKQITVLVGRRIADETLRSLKQQLRMFRRYNRRTRRKVMRRFRYRRYRWRYRSRWRYTFGRYGSYRYRRPGGTTGLPPAPRLSTDVRALLGRPRKPFVNHTFVWQRAKLFARQWPRQWLDYTRFDAVLLRAAEWEQMAASTKIALRRYVEAGGVLAILDPWSEPPKGWARSSSSDGPWRRYEPGFGVALALKQTLDISTGGARLKLWGPVLDAAYEGFLPWQRRYDPVEADGLFSIVGQLKVPVRGIFALMLLFVLLIGPLNFWLLKRLDRRLWTLWTVPTIAFVTCVLLFLYASFSEGWGGHARSMSLTYLDQAHKRASTIGWMGFYLPLTPTKGLRFADDTDLHPELINDGRANRGLHIDWSKGQRLRKGWSLARLPLHFRFRRSERRQERLVVKQKGDGLIVINGLGARIKRLWLRSAKGNYFQAEQIAPGARVALKATEHDAIPATLRRVYKGEWLKQIGALANRPGKFLKRGSYIAELDAPVFTDDAVKQQANIRATSLVYGILGGNDGG